MVVVRLMIIVSPVAVVCMGGKAAKQQQPEQPSLMTDESASSANSEPEPKPKPPSSSSTDNLLKPDTLLVTFEGKVRVWLCFCF